MRAAVSFDLWEANNPDKIKAQATNDVPYDVNDHVWQKQQPTTSSSIPHGLKILMVYIDYDDDRHGSTSTAALGQTPTREGYQAAVATVVAVVIVPLSYISNHTIILATTSTTIAPTWDNNRNRNDNKHHNTLLLFSSF